MVQPVYPPTSISSKEQGTVVLHMIVARDGTVSNVDYVSGPVSLERSAIDAAKQWRYEATLLNGLRVEVDTTVSVVFSLATGNTSPNEGESAKSASGVTVIVPKTVETPVGHQLRADIVRLFALTGVNDSIRQGVHMEMISMRPTIVQELPDTPHREQIVDEFERKIEALASSPEFEDRLIDVYAQYFNDYQIKSVITFCRSPIGRHYNDVQDQLPEGLSAAGQRLVRGRLPEIYREMCTEYPELQGKATFCPAAQQPGLGAAKKQ